jgi:hypothetical protein
MKSLTWALSIAVLSLSFNAHLFGQDKLIISTGIGLPELLHIGARYPFEQAQIGLSVGTFPAGSDESILTVSGDFYFHFAGSSQWSSRRPWYGKIGLNYLRDETDRLIDKYLYLSARIGREFNLSRQFGMTIDLGPAFQLVHEESEKMPSSNFFNLDFSLPVLPGLGVGLFYRIF